MAGQGLFFKSFKLMSSGRSLLNNRITTVNLQLNAMNISQDTRERLTQLKIPEKPKKPLTPYMRFITEHRSEILKSNPNLKPTDLIKKCAEEWKNISSEVKTKYTEKYNLEREKYEVQCLKYHENLSPEQKEAVQDFAEEKKEDKKKRKLRKLYKETNKPKRPMAAYMHYLMDQSKVRNKPIKELMSVLSEEWAKLPAQEKEKYQHMFLQEKKKYEVALAQWENRMLAEGRSDLVRGKSVDHKTPSRIKQFKKNSQQ